MAQSMTGYGKSVVHDEHFQLEIELRTVNNRYLDLHLRVSEGLHFSEGRIRQIISESMFRGRVDLSIKLLSLVPQGNYHLRGDVLTQLVEELEEWNASQSSHFPLKEGMASLLSVPGVIEQTPEIFKEETLLQLLEQGLRQAVADCIQMRQAEGKRLKNNLEEKLQSMETILSSIEARAPRRVEEEYLRLQKNVQELLNQMTADPDRLANEMALFAQRVDVDEEIVRLGSHIASFHEALKRKGPVGKTLDFLVQEMNRETNTIGSKSGDAALTADVIALKTVIEQIREQIQNLE